MDDENLFPSFVTRPGARAWHLRGPPQGTETKGASIAAGSRPGVPGAFFSAFSLDQAFPVPSAPSAFRAR